MMGVKGRKGCNLTLGFLCYSVNLLTTTLVEGRYKKRNVVTTEAKTRHSVFQRLAVNQSKEKNERDKMLMKKERRPFLAKHIQRSSIQGRQDSTNISFGIRIHWRPHEGNTREPVRRTS